MKEEAILWGIDPEPEPTPTELPRRTATDTDDAQPTSELWISELQAESLNAAAASGVGASAQVGILSGALVCGISTLIGLGALGRRLRARA